MKVAVFSTKPYDRQFLLATNSDHAHEFVFFEARLTAVCAFIHDQLNQETLTVISAGGTRLIALRAAGFNNVDLQAAAALEMTVVRVPDYSPYAVAEHTVGLILMLYR